MGCCHFYSNLHLAIKVGWCEIYMKDVIIGTEIDGGTDRATWNFLLQGGKIQSVHYSSGHEVISWFCCKLIKSSVA